MYVHKNAPNYLYLEALKSVTEHPETKGVVNGQRPLPIIDILPEPFSTEKIIRELAPFIEKNDLQGALLLIRSYEKELEKLSISLEEAEEFVGKVIEYNQLLNKVDSMVEHGKFDEATQLVENNSNLIKTMGADPEDIKNLIKDTEKFFALVETIYDLTSKNQTEEANRLIDESGPLLERLDIPSEYLQELFPEITIKVSD